jgi:uncharacterized membrane protein (TIGR02234 family)
LGAAVLLCLVGAFLVLVGAGRVWASVRVQSGPISGVRVVSVPGAEVVAGVRALGLVGLAGVPALVATRRVGRLVVGALLVLTGAGVVVAALGADVGAAAAREAASISTGPPAMAAIRQTVWSSVTAAGGVLLVLAGLLTVLRGTSWPGLGQRYEAPAAAPAAAPSPGLAERGLWEALDRGEDPTGGTGAADPGTR